MKLVEVKHPLVKHKLGVMREADIDTKKFRELATEVGSLLTYEATADLETEKVIIEGWNGPVEIERIKGKKVTVVPILRAGLGMMDGVLEHVPSARISVVGIYRNEETLEPVPYFQKLASDLEERLAIVVDPMLATGGSMISTIDLLKAKGCQHIKVLVLVAAPEGIKALEKVLLEENGKHKDWACTEEMMSLTKDGKALYLHCLPADITGVSCEEGEVDATVFDRYRVPLYKEASYKPYVIAAMIFLSKFKNPVETLKELERKGTDRVQP